MLIQKPEVEFVPIETELVTTTSIKCGPTVKYYCEDVAMEVSGITTCGCGDEMKDQEPACDDDFA